MYDNNSKSGNFHKLTGLSILKPIYKNLTVKTIFYNILEQSLIIISFLKV